MIKIDSVKTSYGFNVKASINSSNVQLTCKIKSFIEHMLKDQPEMMNAIFSELMPAIEESTYNMDPDKFRIYSGIVEGML